jgi:hypothetical protein
LRVHGKSPLADEIGARWSVRAHIACRPALYGETVALFRRDKLYDLSVGDDGDGEAVDLWHA